MVSFSNAESVLEVRHRHEVIRIEAWGADSVRVRAAQHQIPERSVGALGEVPPDGPPGKVSINGTHASLTSGRLRAEVDFDTTASYPEPLITFRHDDGDRAELLAESREHF